MIYNGKARKTVDFGAFVNFLGAKTVLSTFRNCRMAGPKRPPTCKEAIWSRSRSSGLRSRQGLLPMKRVDGERRDLEAESAE